MSAIHSTARKEYFNCQQCLLFCKYYEKGQSLSNAFSEKHCIGQKMNKEKTEPCFIIAITFYENSMLT